MGKRADNGFVHSYLAINPPALAAIHKGAAKAGLSESPIEP